MPIPKIIFEDDYLLVINKPSGLVVNRAESVKGKTLQDWMEEKIDFKQFQSSKENDTFSKRNNVFINRSGLVHRLDKDTSGAMVLAKTPKVFTELQKQFKERKVIKKYLALVHGRVEPKVGDIKMPLGRKPSDRKKFGVRLKGKMAVTEYKVLKYVEKKRETLSLLELNLKTGRTHQIRVHLKHIGYPIVADPIYLGEKRLKKDKEWCPRLFLHSQYLNFIHPNKKERVEFEASLPKEFNPGSLTQGA